MQTMLGEKVVHKINFRRNSFILLQILVCNDGYYDSVILSQQMVPNLENIEVLVRIYVSNIF